MLKLIKYFVLISVINVFFINISSSQTNDNNNIKDLENKIAQLNHEGNKVSPDIISPRKMFEYDLLGRYVYFLKLNSEQEKKFKEIYEKSFEKRGKMFFERMKLVKQVMKDTENNSIPVSELKNILKDIKRLDNEMTKEKEDFFKKSEKILDEKQYIRFVVLEDWIKEDLMRHLREERNRMDIIPKGIK